MDKLKELKDWKLSETDIKANGIINTCESIIENQHPTICKIRVMEKERNEKLRQLFNTRALKPLDEGEVRNLVYSRDSLGTKLYEKQEELIKEFCSQCGVQWKGQLQ